MKSKTPQKKQTPEKNPLDFIEQAEKVREKTHTSLPWESPEIRKDVTKIFNLRLSEKHFLMLKFLAENQKRESMQGICLDTIEPMLERESLELFKKISDK